jgi:hypothetical protein
MFSLREITIGNNCHFEPVQRSRVKTPKVVKIYNTTNSVVRFEPKYFLHLCIKTLWTALVASFVVVVVEGLAPG